MEGVPMSVFAENVAQHSSQFLPSFRLLRGTPPEPPAQLPDLGIAIGRTRRHDGRLGIRPLPLDGQTELARYVGVVTAGAFMTAQGRPPRGPETAASSLRKICFGGGEMLLTERVLAVVISSGDTILGEA